MGDILSLVTSSFVSVVSWLDSMFNAIGGSGVALTVAFLMFCAVRLLLRPLIGSASSDLVKSVKGKKSNDKKE